MRSNLMNWLKRAFEPRKRTCRHQPPLSLFVQPRVEQLEDRLTPSVSIAITNTGWIVSSAKPNDNIAMQTTLANYGNTYAGTVPVEYVLGNSPYSGTNGIFLQTDYRYGFGPYGGSQSWTEYLHLPSSLNNGTYWVNIIADPWGWYGASRSASSYNSVSIMSSPDLAVYSVSAPTTVPPGSTFSVGVGVGNWQNVPSGGFTISVYASSSPNVASGTLLATDYRSSGIAGYSSPWFTENVFAPSLMVGTDYITVQVTPWSGLDANWSNNVLSAGNPTNFSAPSASNPNTVLNGLTTNGAANGGVQASQAMAQADLARIMYGNTTKQEYITAGQIYGLPPALLAAIASRESRGGALLVNGYGDYGNAFGVMQVDKRYWNISATLSGGPFGQATINQAASILAYWYQQAKATFPTLSQAQQLRYAVAAYNAGSKAFWYANPDAMTTGGDYSADVWARAEYYANNVSWS